MDRLHSMDNPLHLYIDPGRFLASGSFIPALKDATGKSTP